jgi:hypothetical protein
MIFLFSMKYRGEFQVFQRNPTKPTPEDRTFCFTFFRLNARFPRFIFGSRRRRRSTKSDPSSHDVPRVMTTTSVVRAVSAQWGVSSDEVRAHGGRRTKALSLFAGLISVEKCVE